MSRTSQSSAKTIRTGQDTSGSASGVNALAQRALSVLAKRRTGVRNLSETYLTRLCDVVATPDPRARQYLVDAMEASGIQRYDICDIYIPEAARRLGEDWVEDRMSFAEVSIRSARLQSMLRDLTRDDGVALDESGGDMALMVTAFETHTLGAMVLTGRLRRIGVSVRLILGRSVDDMAEAAAASGFDGILLSVSQADDLMMVNETVNRLRDVTGGKVPIVVGGGVLDNGVDAACRLTGADHVTNDLVTALELCGCNFERARAT